MAKSDLETLYDFISLMEKRGRGISEDVLSQVAELEEKLIQEDVLPALSEQVAPILNQIRRKLTLVVDYEPGSELSVRMTRKKVVINDTDTKVYSLVPYDKQGLKKRKIKTGRKQGPASHIVVRWPDGTTIAKDDACQTLVAVIERIGAYEVCESGIKLLGNPVVSRENPNTEGVFELGEFFVRTVSNTDNKIKTLYRLSEHFNLGLDIQKKLKPVKGKSK